MMNVKDIQTTDWQMSARKFGDVLQGADDVNQCINIILSTQKGSDPLRPDFGVDLLSWIDKPTTIAAPGLVREIIEQVALYEPRIDLATINYSMPDERVVFSLTWTYKDGVLVGDVTDSNKNTVYFLLGNEAGFVLLSDYNVSVIVK